MNRWGTSAVLFLVAALVGCGSNSTKAGITITAVSATSGATSVTVPVNGTEQFAASVSGVSTTTVQWQVCLPAAVSTKIPTNCTAIPGVTPPSGSTALSGYGTINQNGFYTAPAAVPSPNNFVILATSPADPSAFATFGVIIDSGIRIRLTPASAFIEAGENLQFTATVTGTTNTAITWEVAGVAGGTAAAGFICPSPSAPVGCTPGTYFSPAVGTGTQTITALSGADGTTKATASVTLLSTPPTLSSVQPATAAQGSVQQQVYLNGANFTSTGAVMINGTALPCFSPASTVPGGAAPPCTVISQSLLRVAIPANLLTAVNTLPISFQLQSGASSATQNLTVVPARPSIVAATPQSVTAGSAGSVTLTGGFFSTPASAVQFDGAAASVSNLSSRQLTAALPIVAPGLYPLSVQNTGVPVGQPSFAAVNVAMTPPSVSGGTASIALAGGSQPSAIAIDYADGLAVVAETGANAVALINTTTNAVVATVAVGTQPTGVAIDDMASPHPLALVVNSGSNTISVIDLVTQALAAGTNTISLTNFTPSGSHPVAIGINPQTHRAIVANASTNLATIIDLVNPNPNITPPCTVPPCVLTTIGGGLTSFSTGGNPMIGIDPGLNWAVVTPGGAGAVNLVDLGFGSTSAGSGGRAPAVIGSLTLSTTTQGIGINPETHQALLSDSSSTGSVTEFSLLDNTVTSVNSGGSALSLPQGSASAINSLQNIGVVVNASGSATAQVVDLGNNVVLQSVAGLASSQAIGIDPATDKAFIANSAAGTVTVLSLAPVAAHKPLQILDAGPEMLFTSATSVTLTITGFGFSGTSVVLLDNADITASGGVINSVNLNGRQMSVTLPASLLGSARRFALQVKNPPATVSNVAPITVVQAISVGTAPAGVAVDPYRDLAVVTNSGSNNVSLVSLASPSVSPQSLGPVGVVGTALSAHLNPRAVAVSPRLGLAVVANYSSNDVTLVDYSQVFSAPYSLPAVAGCNLASVCTGPAGAAFNEDTNQFAVTDSNPGAASSGLLFGLATPATPSSAAILSVGSAPLTVDQTPGDLAFAPNFDPANPGLTYAAVASAAQTSVVDFVDVAAQLVVGRTNGLMQPGGVVFDALNNVFLISDSLNNAIVIDDPKSFIPTAVRGGFNPVSLAYNPQTSTIVAVNGLTRTLSVLDYLCPTCTLPHVRTALGLVGSQIPSTAPLGPKTVAIDPRFNLAVLVDTLNNRVLLIPLPY